MDRAKVRVAVPSQTFVIGITDCDDDGNGLGTNLAAHAVLKVPDQRYSNQSLKGASMPSSSGQRRTCGCRVRSLVCAALLLALAASVRSAQATPIYIESGGTTLYEVDSNTGASTLVGAYGVVGVLAQDFSPDGTLYAIFRAGSTSAQLATVNTQTGHATPIGSAAGVPLQAMAFAPDGTLYAGSFTTNNLYTINLATGAPTLVGSLGFNWIMDMAWDPANSTMYAIAASPTCGGSSLYSVNLGSGAGTLVTPVPSDNCLMALTVDSANRLLATDFMSASPLFQLDPATGDLTNLGNTGLGGTMGAATAPIPEPTSIFLLGSGLIGLAGIVRRKAGGIGSRVFRSHVAGRVSPSIGKSRSSPSV